MARGGEVCDIVDFFLFFTFLPRVCGGHFFPTSLLLSLEKTK